MNRIAILVAMVLLVLGGCEAKQMPGMPGTEVRCIHGFATINTRAEHLVVAPANVDVQRGCKLILQIVPPRKDAGDVTIEHVEFPQGDLKRNRWLDKTNTGKREIIVIEVPKDATFGKHEYSVTIPGFDTLDPHATVIPD